METPKGKQEKKRRWSLPSQGRVLACVVNATQGNDDPQGGSLEFVQLLALLFDGHGPSFRGARRLQRFDEFVQTFEESTVQN
jgi:hypothetical protein